MKKAGILRRFACICFALFMIVATFSVVPVRAAGTTEVEFGQVSGKIGEEVTVPVTIRNNPGIACFRFRVSYDSDDLLFTSAEKGEALSGGTFDYKVDAEKKYVTFLWYCTENVVDNGEIAKLKFEIKDTAKGSYDLKVTCLEEDLLNASREKVAYTAKDGIISTGATLSGNITSFGDATSAVAMRLMQADQVIDQMYTTAGTYSFQSLAPGNYTLVVSKQGHATREYAVTVDKEDMTLNVTIHLIGDVNGDGKVNNKDLGVLMQWLNGYDVVIDESAANVNGDGKINNKDYGLLMQYLNGWNVEFAEDNMPLSEDLRQYSILTTQTSADGTICTSFCYGKSVLGEDLVCWSIQQGTYSKTMLLNFAIHGWEDSYAADGQILVDLGNALVEHYAQNANLKNCRLLIIPCANPDGVAQGTTNNGFGRCNADGIDLNRDFDAAHTVYTTARNYTPAPFSGEESKALRDLVLSAKPSVVLDFHGWLNYTIGSSDLAEVFSLYTGIQHKNELTTAAHGYFTYWAQLQGAQALLVEFKDTNSVNSKDVIAAIDCLIGNEYGNGQSAYDLDPTFSAYSPITAYALTSERIYTQRQIGETGTDYGYIDGSTDKCTIIQIYDNGWCKVRYPVGNLTKTGYCKLSAFVDPESRITAYTTQTTQTVTVYTTPAMTTSLGSVWSTDTVTVVAQKDGLAQIIYPLDNGGYKMGWIHMTYLA